MKKSIIFLVALCLTASFTACGNEENSSSVPNVSVNTIEEITAPANESESEKSENSTEEVLTESNVEIESTSGMLVAYFTYAENADLPDNADASASASIQSLNGKLTGNTGVVADMIAQKTGAELFSIQTVKSYPSDYDGTIDEGQAEKNNNPG